jgi:peptidoglycan/xylan/chitin deacetylase (PgdA/CDA1 family)
MRRTSNSVIVTTSWDGGHVLDERIAQLLQTYGLRGTFYVAPGNRTILPADRLTHEQMVHIFEAGFEIGANTVTHPRLRRIDARQAAAEISASKKWLESSMRNPITSFSYPYGEYTQETVTAVAQAGFTFGRTSSRFSRANGVSLEATTSVHAARHLFDLPRLIRLANFKTAQAMNLWQDWSELAITLYDSTPDGSIYHLFGSASSLEKKHDWDRLERVLRHIAESERAVAVNNSGLVK